MGDLIKLYELRKPKIEMLLKEESEKDIDRLKALAYDFFSEGKIEIIDELIKEYGGRFHNSWLTVEKGDILLVYENIPYFICKTKNRIKKELLKNDTE